VKGLFVADSKLYFKASYTCPHGGQYIRTIFHTDGTATGTKDLRADVCPANNTDESKPTHPYYNTKPTAEMWGALLCAALPMIALSTYVLVARKMPGLFLNIYAGVWVAITLLYALSITEVGDSMLTFQKWFGTIYSSLLYIGLVVFTVRVQEPPPWLENLKTWAVAVVGSTFFIIIHIDLEIPMTGYNWPWVVFFVLVLLQMVASSILTRIIPMIYSAIGLFEVAWRISYEIVHLIFGGLSGEGATLTMLLILALQGIGIILLAVGYAAKKAQIDGSVREMLKGNRNFASLLSEDDPA